MIVYSSEIQKALTEKLPIVALESTIISFGMPYPLNYEVAKNVENIIREQGAVPATIGIMDGKIHIGLSDKEIEFFASSQNIIKASTRDIPYIVALKKHGATTVAATIECASMGGIDICVTGGIGGVHRDAAESFDISADLHALAKVNIGVVCSGVKSILDVAKTKEYLETLGIPIIGYRCEKLPLFFSYTSEYSVDHQIDSISDIANMLYIKNKMCLPGSTIIANPVPKEKEISKEKIEMILLDIEEKMRKLKIKGKAITPFLLSEIEKRSNGESLQANIALIENNAKVGAELAVAYNKITTCAC